MGLFSKNFTKTNTALYTDGNILLYLAQDNKSGLFGVYDKNTDKLITKLKYDNIDKYIYGVAIFREKGKKGLLNIDGEEVVKAKYDEMIKVEQDTDLYVVKLGAKYGIIDSQGKELVHCVYDEIGFISEGFYSVKRDGKYGIVDRFDGDFYESAPTDFNKPLMYATTIKEQKGKAFLSDISDPLGHIDAQVEKQMLKRETVADKERMIAYFMIRINQYYYKAIRLVEIKNQEPDRTKLLNLDSDEIIETLFDDEQAIYDEFDELESRVKNFEPYDLAAEFSYMGDRFSTYGRIYKGLGEHIEKRLGIQI